MHRGRMVHGECRLIMHLVMHTRHPECLNHTTILRCTHLSRLLRLLLIDNRWRRIRHGLLHVGHLCCWCCIRHSWRRIRHSRLWRCIRHSWRRMHHSRVWRCIRHSRRRIRHSRLWCSIRDSLWSHARKLLTRNYAIAVCVHGIECSRHGEVEIQIGY